MQVEARILATLRQPMKLKSRLALQAWEPSVHAPCNKKCKRRQVMHGVHQPSMHLEVCFASCVICPDPIIPSLFQLIHQWSCMEYINTFNVKNMCFLCISTPGGRLSGMMNT